MIPVSQVCCGLVQSQDHNRTRIVVMLLVMQEAVTTSLKSVCLVSRSVICFCVNVTCVHVLSVCAHVYESCR